ncbi:Density-regulated protein [Strongyloides ratti]|uniref:Density-regulated protein homolog n=1 Tax=Strongyloides ratti TaxID=34506 RepID=A0A090LCI3_STRRB|nr:Density-regulated protein [Strongyloides ratti]CEF65828.1 Density-regulated protein [Strongyloides ratti]
MAEIEEKKVTYPLKVVYCSECTMPLEYCEYSGKKCATRSTQEVTESVDGIIITDNDVQEETKHQTRGGRGTKGKVAFEEPQTITLQRASRGKNKYTTIVKNLSTHKVDLKVAAKFFSSKFACGSSVTGPDEIVIQGDVTDELFDVIPAKWPHITDDDIEDLGDGKK